MQRSPLSKKHQSKLSEYGLEKIPLDSCICISYRAGENISEEGQPITYLSIVTAGRAKVCSTAKNGKNLVLCYYISDGIIGDIELMTENYSATANVIAITDLECISIPYRRNAAVLKQNLAFINRVGRELALKLRRSSGNYISSALFSGEERLCAYILQTEQNDIFSGNLTDVSSSVGISYRHMFRLLNQLCKEEIMAKRKNGYQILNREALSKRAFS